MRTTRTTFTKALLALSLVLLVGAAGVGVASAVPQGPGVIQNTPPEPGPPEGPDEIANPDENPPPPDPDPQFEGPDGFAIPTPCTHGCGPEGPGIEPGGGSGGSGGSAGTSDEAAPAPEAADAGADPAVADAPSTDGVEITMLGPGEPRETTEVAAGTDLDAEAKTGLPGILWALVAVLLAAAAGLWLVIARRRRDDDAVAA